MENPNAPARTSSALASKLEKYMVVKFAETQGVNMDYETRLD